MKVLLGMILILAFLGTSTTITVEQLKAQQIQEVVDFVKEIQVPLLKGVIYPGRTSIYGAKPDRFDWESVLEQPLDRRWGYVWGCETVSYGMGEVIQVCPDGACDSREECEEEMDTACENAGHEGVDPETVELNHHADGSSTCSGDCLNNGAIAFVTCRS